jgi:hypothetical protein
VIYLVGFVWLELIDAALYLNHYWLMTLLGVLLLVLPSGDRWATDVRAAAVAEQRWIPAWVVWVVRGQIAVVYVFAAIGKVNGDWLVHGPAAGDVVVRAHRPPADRSVARRAVGGVGGVVGRLGISTSPSSGGSSGGGRDPGPNAAVVGFHVGDGDSCSRSGCPVDDDRPHAGVLRTRLARTIARAGVSAPSDSSTVSTSVRGAARVAVAVLVVVNVVVPLRHVVYPGDVRWNEETATTGRSA